MESTEGFRLKEVIKTLELTNIKFAEALDIAPNYVSMIISGKKSLTDSLKMSITKNYPQANLSYIENNELPILKTIEPDIDLINGLLKNYIDSSLKTALEDKLGHINKLCEGINKDLTSLAFNMDEFRDECEVNLKDIHEKLKSIQS